MEGQDPPSVRILHKELQCLIFASVFSDVVTSPCVTVPPIAGCRQASLSACKGSAQKLLAAWSLTRCYNRFRPAMPRAFFKSWATFREKSWNGSLLGHPRVAWLFPSSHFCLHNTCTCTGALIHPPCCRSNSLMSLPTSEGSATCAVRDRATAELDHGQCRSMLGLTR